MRVAHPTAWWVAGSAPAVALTVASVGLGIAAAVAGEGTWAGPVLLPAMTIPLLWRRSRPLACALCVAAGMAVSALPALMQTRCAIALPAALLAVFALASRAQVGASVAGLAALAGGLLVVGKTDPVVAGDAAGFAAVAIVLLVVAFAGAATTGLRRRLAAQLARRSQALEQRREDVAQLAVDVERSRLAGELDAVVREHVRRIATLAQDDRPDFAGMETAARAALDEMRSLLRVLHDVKAAERLARPTLGELDALFDRTRAAGKAVDVRFEGVPAGLPEAVELAAYRVIEHGLAAVAAPARVILCYTGDGLELVIHGRPEKDETHALDAARERAVAHGGRLSIDNERAGPRRVRAWIPAHG